MRPSKKTTGTCRVCGDICHPQQGQRIAEHTEASHYVDPMEDIPPARRRQLRAEWIERNLKGNPVMKLLGKRAQYRIFFPGPTVKGSVRIASAKLLRVASGVFDFSGQVFCFVEDDGAYWDIDQDTAMNVDRLKTVFTFKEKR